MELNQNKVLEKGFSTCLGTGSCLVRGSCATQWYAKHWYEKFLFSKKKEING